jgi:hypothetical protein
MNKVWVNRPYEGWICDVLAQRFMHDNADICVNDPHEADVIWLLADWTWRQVPRSVLTSKKVLTTIHHIVPQKFGDVERRDFDDRDVITNAYHVFNDHTYEFIRPLTDKPIHIIQYWADTTLWKPTNTKAKLREKHGLPIDAYICGSFQRDTEGAGIPNGIFLPKLEKGPDIFASYVMQLRQKCPNLYVLLAGWRRQYLIERLENASVPFSYIELPSQVTLNELYQTLDLYPIASRFEGGPQALIECGLLNVPVVSHHVGIAEQVLPPSAINDDLIKAIPTCPDVSNMLLPNGYEDYRNAFKWM